MVSSVSSLGMRDEHRLAAGSRRARRQHARLLDHFGRRNRRRRAIGDGPPTIFLDADRHRLVARAVEVLDDRRGGRDRDFVLARAPAVDHADPQLLHDRIIARPLVVFLPSRLIATAGAPRRSDDAARLGRDARLHAGGHAGHGEGDDRRAISRTSARRSSSATPITSLCGRATISSPGGAAFTGSWAGRGRSSPTAAAIRSSASRPAAGSTKTACAFRSHLDGTAYELTPEKAVDIQAQLGSDIAMVLDECPGAAGDRTALGATRSS